MMHPLPPRVSVIDSHTGGEPTRVVVVGGPDLGPGDLAARLRAFREKHDHFRSAVVNEPRGSDVLVGALLCEPGAPDCVAGAIFFNNVGYLGMCGHGTIGVVVTLAHLGLVGPGTHRLDTPVGVVEATLEGQNLVTVRNVPSYRTRAGVRVEVEGIGPITGDVAWGGNWFFLVHDPAPEIAPANAERLTDLAWRIRQALAAQGITGDDGHEIDHVELFGPPTAPGAHGKNFVLCPGKAYDRSPCGTGTSAKVACLMADGKLREGQRWRQEGILGSTFDAFATLEGGKIVPLIQGSAFVTSEATLIFDEDDPLRLGARP